MSFPVELSPKYQSLAVVLNVHAEDIDEQFIRGRGKGGQKMNKTSSCVLLKHRPTGIEVRCQRYREQSANRLTAYRLLIQKIDESVRGKESEKAQKIFKLRKQKMRRSRKAKQRMLEEKRHHGMIKEARHPLQDVP